MSHARRRPRLYMYLFMTVLTVLGVVIGVRLSDGPCEKDDGQMHEAQSRANQALRGCQCPGRYTSD